MRAVLWDIVGLKTLTYNCRFKAAKKCCPQLSAVSHCPVSAMMLRRPQYDTSVIFFETHPFSIRDTSDAVDVHIRFEFSSSCFPIMSLICCGVRPHNPPEVPLGKLISAPIASELVTSETASWLAAGGIRLWDDN